MSAPAGYGRSAMMGCGIAFSVLPTLLVALRFYARGLDHAKYGIHDWILIPALIGCIGLGGLEISVLKDRLGQHPSIPGDSELMDSLMNSEMEFYEKCRYAFDIIGTIELTLVKISILLFYRLLLAVQTTKCLGFTTINNILIGLVSVWGFSFTVVITFQCSPVSTLWNTFEFDHQFYCVNQESLYLSFAVTNVILDTTILIIPLAAMYGLQLDAGKRLEMMGIFCLGLIPIIAGLFRCVIFGQIIAFHQSNATVFFEDITYYATGFFIWTHIESAVAIIAVCLPTLGPLASFLFRPSSQRRGRRHSPERHRDCHHSKKILSKRGVIVPLEGRKLSRSLSDESQCATLHSNAVAPTSSADTLGTTAPIISEASITDSWRHPTGNHYHHYHHNNLLQQSEDQQDQHKEAAFNGAVFQYPAGVWSETHIETATIRTVPSFGIRVRKSVELSNVLA